MILDTNAVSAILAGDALITPVLRAVQSLCIPAIVIGEYRYGIAASRRAETLTTAFERLLRAVTVLPVDELVAARYASVRRTLKEAGTPIPENDVWIAATALRNELPLLSRDTHYDLVPGLKRIGW